MRSGLFYHLPPLKQNKKLQLKNYLLRFFNFFMFLDLVWPYMEGYSWLSYPNGFIYINDARNVSGNTQMHVDNAVMK
jgi:hypothetical protein